jgi:hypothetical protein
MNIYTLQTPKAAHLSGFFEYLFKNPQRNRLIAAREIFHGPDPEGPHTGANGAFRSKQSAFLP